MDQKLTRNFFEKGLFTPEPPRMTLERMRTIDIKHRSDNQTVLAAGGALDHL